MSDECLWCMVRGVHAGMLLATLVAIFVIVRKRR